MALTEREPCSPTGGPRLSLSISSIPPDSTQCTKLTVSKRSLEQDSVEFKLRKDDSKISVSLAKAVEHTLQAKADLETEIAAKVVEVPFDES